MALIIIILFESNRRKKLLFGLHEKIFIDCQVHLHCSRLIFIANVFGIYVHTYRYVHICFVDFGWLWWCAQKFKIKTKSIMMIIMIIGAVLFIHKNAEKLNKFSLPIFFSSVFQCHIYVFIF